MTSTERVIAAIEFEQPDRLPRWDNLDGFGDFPGRWRSWKGFGLDVDPTDFYEIDVSTSMSEEGPFFTKSRIIGHEGSYEIFLDSWGRTVRQRPGNAYFMEALETMLSEKSKLERLEFEDATDDGRYIDYVKRVDAEKQAGRLPFSKIGGIYCRSQFMRREDRLLMDMATDEEFCHALFSRVAEHLTQVAIEELRRTNSWTTGIWVYDDCANSVAPMFSPTMFEKYFLPNYSTMIETLKSRGCQRFFFHSDGNIGPLIDLLIEAGFNGLNPLEPRCGLDLVKLRKRYGRKLVFFGGICNTQILPRGDKKEIEAHVRPLIELGRNGGLVIGSASIGDDVCPEVYDYYISLLEKYGQYR